MPFKSGDIITLPEEKPKFIEGRGWLSVFAGAIVEFKRSEHRYDRKSEKSYPVWMLSHITMKNSTRRTTSYWVYEAWLLPPTSVKPKVTCNCSLIDQGCVCGEFAREMTAKGKTYCSYLRSWVVKK